MPDAGPLPTEQAAPSVETRFPCPQCGAALRYLPGTDRVQCSHCGHESVIRPVGTPIAELDYQAALEALRQQAPVAAERTIACAGCGASFAFDPAVAAGACPYCGSPIVAAPAERTLIKPQALMPFVLSEADAKARLQDWLRSLWFAPAKVKRYAQGEGAMTGVYVPYWTFDADTESTYVGQRGVFYQVPESVMVQSQGRTVRRQRMVTKVRWSPARGRVQRRFDDVLALASRSLPQDLTADLTPWLHEALVPYQPDYLSGFRSETYQIGLEDGFAEASKEMAQVIRADAMRDIGGDLQRIHAIDTHYGGISFKHVLLPVWVAAYRYGGKAYPFVVNGQTGEVQGKRPYSPIKIALAVILALVLLLLAAVLFAPSEGDLGSWLPLLGRILAEQLH